MGVMLDIKDINVFYGAIHAIKGISLTVNEGEIVTLIGANGAGKSTTLRTISGLLKPKTGSITFLGKEIGGMPANKIVHEGISQVPEGRRIFAEMTVLENLELGAFIRTDADGIAADLEMVFKRFPRLDERRAQLAGTLSGGEQQMLAMGRALMSRPKLLLMDEPSMGLAPLLIREIFSTRPARRFCSSSRMRIWRYRSQTARMCWRRGASLSRATRRNWRRARTFARHISAVKHFEEVDQQCVQ